MSMTSSKSPNSLSSIVPTRFQSHGLETGYEEGSRATVISIHQVESIHSSRFDHYATISMEGTDTSRQDAWLRPQSHQPILYTPCHLPFVPYMPIQPDVSPTTHSFNPHPSTPAPSPPKSHSRLFFSSSLSSPSVSVSARKRWDYVFFPCSPWQSSAAPSHRHLEIPRQRVRRGRGNVARDRGRGSRSRDRVLRYRVSFSVSARGCWVLRSRWGRYRSSRSRRRMRSRRKTRKRKSFRRLLEGGDRCSRLRSCISILFRFHFLS